MTTPPRLTLAERDRRWRGLQALMRARDLEAIVVGSFQGRERLESYLIDDFYDSVVVLPALGDATVLTFATNRVSRAHESARRGEDIWAPDIRIGFGGAKTAEVLREKGVRRRIGLVGYGPTAPGEAEGLLPLGFHRNLAAALPEVELADFTRDFTDFVLVKSAEEIALLRHAAAVSEEACRAMIAACRPGATEADVYAEIQYAIHKRGCDLRYPFLSLQSGPDNIGWGVPRWTLRAEPPRTLARGDLVQAEIHTCYGGQESQVQMAVGIGPLADDLHRCAAAAEASYRAGLAAVKPGATFAEVVRAMEAPLAEGGFWAKTPLLHTLTFGSTGFTPVNRHHLAGTFEERIEGGQTPGIRRGELVLQPGMGLELEPNACIGLQRVNIGGAVLVTGMGAEELNTLPLRLHVLAG